MLVESIMFFFCLLLFKIFPHCKCLNNNHILFLLYFLFISSFCVVCFRLLAVKHLLLINTAEETFRMFEAPKKMVYGNDNFLRTLIAFKVFNHYLRLFFFIYS